MGRLHSKKMDDSERRELRRCKLQAHVGDEDGGIIPMYLRHPGSRAGGPVGL